MLPRAFVLSLTAAAALAACTDDTDQTAAQTTPSAAAGVKLVKVGTFEQPVYVTSPPGDTRRLFVVEQPGRIRIFKGGKLQKTPFLDIRKSVTAGGEQGLLSIAFPPDYAKTGRFYVYFTDKQQNQRIVEYRRTNADRANAKTARLVLKMADDEGNHNGGLMVYDRTGKLLVGTGDGGGGGDEHGRRGNAQDLGSLLGKLLRIDPKKAGSKPYTVPGDNPFMKTAGARPEIFAYGLRNPWRFSLDRSSGHLTIGDVGQGDIEEIDYVAGTGSGANFGWRPFEGSKTYKSGEQAPDHVKPVIEQTHDDGWCSITGGYVVRDKAVPALHGRYVYGDFCQGILRSAVLAEGGATDDKPVGLGKVASLSSFGEDARGRVHVVSLEGPVYRLAAR